MVPLGIYFEYIKVLCKIFSKYIVAILQVYSSYFIIFPKINTNDIYLSFVLQRATSDDQLFKFFLMFSYIYVNVKFNLN